LPNQFTGGVWIFLFEGIRKIDLASIFGQVFLMEEADGLDLALEVGDMRSTELADDAKNFFMR